MANTKEKRLDALNHELAIALATLNYPGPPWPGRSTQPSDEASVASQDLDVLIIGAGMCGQSVAFALRREGIHRLRVVDKANCGQEGPWTSYARMNTLRSPKHLTGPDLGIPSLSFRTWFSTQHGEAAWTSLYKIDRLDWNNYLHWLRKQTGVRVDNGIEFKSVKPHGEDPDHKLEVSLEHRSDGRKELVSCR
ncbi:MAG: NAD(P)/FAD-dependent oxidoreductase, partial [Betaproteobacteria bacterium]|nr:NAD(P)/FAD-dependent oxidoreductase [Betaproteobacteria bacterium]